MAQQVPVQVRLQGLKEGSRYEGLTGVLGAWDEENQRFIVTLDCHLGPNRLKYIECQQVRVKKENIARITPEEDATANRQKKLHTAHVGSMPVVDINSLTAGHLQTFSSDTLADPFTGTCCVSLSDGDNRVGFGLLISVVLLDHIGLGRGLADDFWRDGPDAEKIRRRMDSVSGQTNRAGNVVDQLQYVAQLCMGVFEFTRRFSANTITGINQFCWIGVDKIDEHTWRAAPSVGRHWIFHTVVPSELEHGNRKCCAGKFGYAGHGTEERCLKCVECKGGACKSERGPMIWCDKCLVIGWCSNKCRKRMKESHAAMCDLVTSTNNMLGLSAVCYCCGVSSLTDGVLLRLCRQCKVAKYCSRECQQLDWERNHKTTCKKYKKVEKC